MNVETVRIAYIALARVTLRCAITFTEFASAMNSIKIAIIAIPGNIRGPALAAASRRTGPGGSLIRFVSFASLNRSPYSVFR